MSLPSLGGYAAWMRAKQEWTSDDAVLSLLSLEAYLAYATHCQRAESGAETHYLGTLPGEDNNNTETMEFGKHEGKTFDEVPESYKLWMLGKIAEGGSRHQQSVKMCIHYLEELQTRG